MCGIVGFLDKKKKLSSKDSENLIKKMVESIDHRGRDDSGFYVDKNITIGHTRLSILDLSKKGAQPFFDPEEDFVLSYNGEIYNFQEINRELQKKYKLDGNCDTETLLYSYLEKGAGCLEKIKGMFAFSVYEKKKQNIFLAVDRFSIKPLYYIDNDDWFAWSSEIKSLLLLPNFAAELNEEKLYEFFLFKRVGNGETLFKNIKRFIPAETLTYDIKKDKIKKEIYWHLKKQDLGKINFEQELRKRLKDSVKGHLLSDVPVGVQLSGGVDSSMVTVLSTLYKTDLNTYSIGLKDNTWNEFQYSRWVAKKYGTIHHELTFTEEDFCRALPELTYFHDEPIGHSHSVPMYFLAREARKDVKVLLSGEGADEVFFGYKRYLNLFGQNLQTEEIIFSNVFNEKKIAEKIFLPSVANVLSSDYHLDIIKATGDLPLVDKISYYDLQTYLPPLLLRQDKMGMAANLENRVPFLDHNLVEFGFSLPENLKINNHENKILLKKIAEEFFSKELIYRKKCGFGQPIFAWLKNEKGLGAFLKMFNKENQRRSFFNYKIIQQLIDEHKSGKNNHAESLWVIINLEIWLRIFIDKEKPEDIIHQLYE